ncbi:hypothetical protein Tco_1137202, partial [Tanacetum coccineum]
MGRSSTRELPRLTPVEYEDGGRMRWWSLAGHTAQAKNTLSQVKEMACQIIKIHIRFTKLRRPERCEIEGTHDELLNESLLEAATKEKEACLFDDLAQQVWRMQDQYEGNKDVDRARLHGNEKVDGYEEGEMRRAICTNESKPLALPQADPVIKLRRKSKYTCLSENVCQRMSESKWDPYLDKDPLAQRPDTPIIRHQTPSHTTMSPQSFRKTMET